MKKEEFPTFLNEQPTIIFGRTGRELMIIAIGITLAYLCWQRLNILIPDSAIGLMVLKGVISVIPLAGSVAVALITVAGRPLEEWAFAGLFYFLIPKVFIYMPSEEDSQAEDDEDKDDSVASDQPGNLREDDY